MNQEIARVKQRYKIIGDSPALLEAIGRAIRVAPVDMSVLIIGESGAGKEFFPKIIHDNSPRKHKKYIAVNCGAIPEGTIESELFGHVKGSFTGATSDHKGYFEEADGGTIFLDEVAEMPMSTQARLLRVLESGEFMRVGESNVRKTNIRIVAATNKNMDDAIKQNKFREDLYYRLSTVLINVPPLRERGERDIRLLTRKFSHDFADDHTTPPVEFAPDATDMLVRYRWPGNVRQLKSVIEQVALFEAGSTVTRERLAAYLPPEASTTLPVPEGESQFDYKKDRQVIFAAILSMQHDINMLKKTYENEGTTRINSEPDDLRRLPAHRPVGPDDKTDYTFVDYAAPQAPVFVRQSADAAPEHIATDIGYADEAPHVKTLEETEREVIADALRRHNGRRKATANELQISERTLYRKIKQYGLTHL